MQQWQTSCVCMGWGSGSALLACQGKGRLGRGPCAPQRLILYRIVCARLRNNSGCYSRWRGERAVAVTYSDTESGNSTPLSTLLSGLYKTHLFGLFAAQVNFNFNAQNGWGMRIYALPSLHSTANWRKAEGRFKKKKSLSTVLSS